MRREAKFLLTKACDSLVLAIELFNRPHDRGRVSGTLIQLDHAFEMLMKAAIMHRGGRIRERRAKETIGFDACVRQSLSNGALRFINQEQALVLQTINGLRDAAQHHLLDISEGQLYIHVQSGVTLFRDLLRSVFGYDLAKYLPARVLPISTSPPTTVATLFEFETEQIKKLLNPFCRRRVEAMARLRPLAILDGTIRGEKVQPSDRELNRLGQELHAGKAWTDIFKGVSAIEWSSEGIGPAFSLRISKKEGIPIQMVPEGKSGASVVAVRRVNELDYYSLGARQLAKNLGVSSPKAIAAVEYLGIRSDPECYKEFHIGQTLHKRYSPKALDVIRKAFQAESPEEIWGKHKQRNKLNQPGE